MSRSRRRISRALVVGLILATGIGLYATVKKLRHQDAATEPHLLMAVDQSPIPGAAAPPAGLPGRPDEAPIPTPAVMFSPATRPVPALIDTPAVAPTPAQPTVSLSSDPLADARAKSDAGEMIAARSILNAALAAGRLVGSEPAAAKELLGKINDAAIFGRRVFKDDSRAFAYTVQFGDRLEKLATSNDTTWELLCRINGITDPKRVRAGQTLKVIKGPFHAVITKSRFTIDLYLGTPGAAGAVLVKSYPVGLGKDDSTPAGTWVVEPHKKLKKPTYYSPRGEGIIEADDPKNPLGGFWIGLAGVDGQAVGRSSYGIHGTIEPDTIGREASMGCIRMRNEDVALVFEMLVEGKSTVVVKD